MKRGELSIQFMVLAALALIFLIVVAFVMTGRIGVFSKSVGACEQSGGTCMGGMDASCKALGGTASGLACDTGICCMQACEQNDGICRNNDNGCNSGEDRTYVLGCPSGKLCCVR
jgi:hypothetical protein